MSTRTLATPTVQPQPKRRTPTPGGVADYAAPGKPVVLVVELAAYGVAEPVIPRGEWERADWEMLAHLAGA